LIDPFKIVRWASAFVMAFGGFGVAAIFLSIYHSKSREQLIPGSNKTQDLLLLFSICYLALGMLAGGDMTRILFLGFPFIMSYALMLLKKEKITINITVLVLSLPLMRLHKTIPLPEDNWDLFANWFPEFSAPHLTILYLSYSIIFIIFLYLYKVKKVPN
jgi:hypothetical protein